MAGESQDGGDINNGGGAEETLSPKNRVKFLCSHGGRIVPRPIDGQLKYVGGETRVIAIPHDISLSELMKKLTALFDRDMVLKYQVIPEDLEALVSVRSEEDLKHMLDEYDRHESEGTPRLRAFLFPSNPIIVNNQATTHTEPHPLPLEQRYVDAINGIIRTPAAHSKHNSVNANLVTFSISSACSSPHCSSPKGQRVDDTIFSNGHNLQNAGVSMHKVQSSPSLCSPNNFQPNSNSRGNHHFYQHHPHLYQNHPYHQYHQVYHPRPPILDPQRGVGGEMFARTLSSSRTETARSLMGYGLNNYYAPRRYQREGRGCNNCGYYDECGFNGCDGLDISGSLPRSPRKAIWD